MVVYDIYSRCHRKTTTQNIYSHGRYDNERGMDG